jgi:peptidoglycan/xylan/chitin deacetylase (PgdA/CDA1 family)
MLSQANISGLLQGFATILVLHRIELEEGQSRQLDPGLAITAGFLDAAVEHVLAQGADVVGMQQVCQRMNAKKTARPMVVFTFDDGYRDNATCAAPIFAKYKVPWCLYLTSGFPDGTCNYWWRLLEEALWSRPTLDIDVPGLSRTFPTSTLSEKQAAFLEIRTLVQRQGIDLLPYLQDRYDLKGDQLLAKEAMSWSDVKELLNDKNFELGAHTVSHPVLSKLDDDAARAEIAGSRSRISEATGIAVNHFAYPYGDANAAGPREYKIAEEAGYRSAASTVGRSLYHHLPENAYALPRVFLDGRDQRLSQLDRHLRGVSGLAAYSKAKLMQLRNRAG